MTALLEACESAASGEVAWMGGRLVLRVTAYTQPADLPEELVTSVRCIVHVDNRIVVCENESGFHIWPGGGRKPGETFADTARREVHEETGWLIDESTIRTLGWLHHEHINPAPDGHPYPHPDFLNPVLSARARERDGGEAAEWSDIEGYEVASRLVTVDRARKLLKEQPGDVHNYPVYAAFLDRLDEHG
jgi:8-oxo-dGTP pyrophosphatase MutT (NUDIX family)